MAQAVGVRAIVWGTAIPVSLVIDETNLPLQVSTGDITTLAFTVTNEGSAASTAGTIEFDTTDPSLALQQVPQQVLPAIPAGGSATISFTVQATAPSTSINGSPFQINVTAGDQIATLSEDLLVG